jgi:predicted nucleic acid-binding protein
MTISIDTNVISALWNDDDPLNIVAAQRLDGLIGHEQLVISGVVYAELMAGPLRDEASLDMFFEDTGIEIDWTMEREIWCEAGKAYRGFAQRRKNSGSDTPRRILADFLIGAHALVRGYAMLTIDFRHYKAAFPALLTLPV